MDILQALFWIVSIVVGLITIVEKMNNNRKK